MAKKKSSLPIGDIKVGVCLLFLLMILSCYVLVRYATNAGEEGVGAVNGYYTAAATVGESSTRVSIVVHAGKIYIMPGMYVDKVGPGDGCATGNAFSTDSSLTTWSDVEALYGNTLSEVITTNVKMVDPPQISNYITFDIGEDCSN